MLVLALSACASQSSAPETPKPASVTPNPADPTTVLYNGLGTNELRLAEAAIQDALERNPSKRAASWRSDASGRAGTVTPLRTFRAAEGFFCREFEETVNSPDGARSAMRVACRTDDGQWRPARRADPI